MPIRTFLHGVLFVMAIVAAAFGTIALDAPSAAAKEKRSTTAKGNYSTTKKGVRKSTAYSRRSPARKRIPYAPVALPVEIAGDEETAAAVSRAMQYVGTRYKWGGTNPQTGFDCSGFIRYVYGDQAAVLPRTAAGMDGALENPGTLRPGDIVFFGRGRTTHAGIYAGDGKVVHASTPRTGVTVHSLSTLASSLGFRGVGRVI